MQKLLGKIIILSLITATMLSASNEYTLNTKENRSDSTMENKSYKHMTTAQLQEEVERRSINGNLSFDMGLELIRRWSNQ